jgi:hypothetical protein
MLKEELILRFRKAQTLISVLLFFIVTLFFLTVSEENISDIQISHWGTGDVFGWIFNYTLMILSTSIFINTLFYIKNNNRIQKKNKEYIIFLTISLCLFFTGFFDYENYKILHNIFAFFYFFSYPLAIFSLAYSNRKNIVYKEWFFHLSMSLTMIILPLSILTLFDGMGIGEIVHSIIVSVWNLRINFNFKNNGLTQNNI